MNTNDLTAFGDTEISDAQLAELLESADFSRLSDSMEKLVRGRIKRMKEPYYTRCCQIMHNRRDSYGANNNSSINYLRFQQ